MIKQLTIKNLAIIDDISIDFEDNFNVLSGETGAGKSIIIDAISLIFGGRASNDLIAYGKDSATITALIYLNDDIVKEISPYLDIDISNEFIISRVLNTNGRNVCKINGEIIPVSTLNKISNKIVDISSQNESQFLLNEKYHLNLLINYALNHNKDFLNDYQNEFNKYKEILNKIEELENSKDSNIDIDYLNFKYNDLKDYNYTIEDEENILNEYKSLQNAYKNMEAIEEIINTFENDNGINNQIYSCLKTINRLNLDEELANRLNSLYIDLDDFITTFKAKYNPEAFDSNHIDDLSNKITKINSLKRKYNVNNLLNYKNELKAKIDLYSNYDEKIQDLIKEKEKQEKILNEKALKVSKYLHEESIKLSNEVIHELNDLYLENASFSIRFEKVDYNKFGFENAKFYMSANKGNEEMPLIKVASGGEVSRIMLGLKSVFTKLFKVDIVIFDEIDTGVSGKVAMAMGKKMQSISSYCQVLAITHLPQVAAMSDHHYYISKSIVNEKTNTNVKKLTSEEKVYEVARLLSGEEITLSFINSARELINQK